jgi:hypothetical protein
MVSIEFWKEFRPIESHFENVPALWASSWAKRFACIWLSLLNVMKFTPYEDELEQRLGRVAHPMTQLLPLHSNPVPENK